MENRLVVKTMVRTRRARKPVAGSRITQVFWRRCEWLSTSFPQLLGDRLTDPRTALRRALSVTKRWHGRKGALRVLRSTESDHSRNFTQQHSRLGDRSVSIALRELKQHLVKGQVLVQTHHAHAAGIEHIHTLLIVERDRQWVATKLRKLG
jgi:hypothetical protein